MKCTLNTECNYKNTAKLKSNEHKNTEYKTKSKTQLNELNTKTQNTKQKMKRTFKN